jgi:Na+/H+ antiporter NhaD/arsenite permease-like protein
MTASVVAICAAVYLGMILGALPFLQLDRTGIALLGAIALVGTGALSPEQAALSVHLPTLLLLFSFMVIAAQMRLGGFYDWVTLRLAALPLQPVALLAAVIAVVGLLSAVFSNDVVCLAVAPALVDACARRRLNPVPFLLALACSANVGSAATLIGNPQNMLIGQVLNVPFAGYLHEAGLPVLGGLVAIWALIAWQARGRWGVERIETETPAAPDGVALDPWQTAKGLAVASALVVAFVFTSWPREVAALIGAGLLLPMANPASDGPLLALASTLSGNLLIVGSIANIIVVAAARRRGIHIDWRRHARTGVPVTLLTLAITAVWLALHA